MTQEYKTLGEMTDAEIGALVRAKNAGKVIEVWDSVECAWASSPDPGWYARVPYRVRPEPERETVTLYICESENALPCLRKIGTINLTGGKPDCGSIKMEPL